jgi:hypothetical protein
MVPDDNWNEQSLSFPKCMDDDCKVGGDDLDSVVDSYRNYYNSKKKSMFRFTYKNVTFQNLSRNNHIYVGLFF